MNAKDKKRVQNLSAYCEGRNRVVPSGFNVDIMWLCSKVEELEADIKCMVNKAADNKLDGYRELGTRAAKAEEGLTKVKGQRDISLAAIIRIHTSDETDSLTFADIATRVAADAIHELAELEEE